MSELRVLFLAAEAEPLIKIGGLGDVAGSLPLALRQLGASGDTAKVDVRLVIPFHGAMQRRSLPLHHSVVFSIPYAGGQTRAEVLTMAMDDLPVYLISGPLIPPDAPVYTPDAELDGLKFTFFSLAALELTRLLNWRPSILHANDWHTAPAIYALSRSRDQDPFFRHTATVLSLHNLPYMGAGAGPALRMFGLPPATGSNLPWWAQDMPLPLGLLTADHIVAVSPTYAKEILTPESGAGLHEFLRTRSKAITGILNGLDTEHWNPETDDTLVSRFSAQNLEARLANKTALQAEFGLKVDPRAPLLGMITRMDHQKGVDLVPDALRILAKLTANGRHPWQVIILGQGDPWLEAASRQSEADFPQRVRVAIRFDAALSRRIYAGADILIIPSRYEPCGLAQMIAMRYGCVPVGRATGGLCDTIRDYDQSANSTGFLFDQPTPEELAKALRRALQVYRKPKEWRALQQRGMQRDFSWKRSAQQYLDLYLDLVKKRASRSF